MDNLFQVNVFNKTISPQTLIYAAMHQDYSESYVWEESPHFPTEQRCGEIAVKRLLAGERGHYGAVEHPSITFAVGYFPHSVMQQARTHRIGTSFDVQCLTGDTLVTFINNTGCASEKKTISDLYDLWVNGEKAVRVRNIKGRKNEPPGEYRRDCRKRIQKMRVRVLDESSNTFTEGHIEDVVFSGLNPVYTVTLADGKRLECTQNHQIYTPYGWRVLSQLSVGSHVMVNGIPLCDADKTYQNKDWLQEHFNKGLIPRELAAIAGCSSGAVKKWAYIHGLTWQKRKWNKGIRYRIDISPEERARRSQRLKEFNMALALRGYPSGEDHPSWKNLPVGKRVYGWLKYARQSILDQKGEVCRTCGETSQLHCHHILSVKERPDLAFNLDNIEILCSSCHSRHHHAGTKNPVCAHPVEIVSIEYKGVEATYDLAMSAPNHNFVANGVVVHNSMRYTSKRILAVAEGKTTIEEVFYLRPIGTYTDRSGKKYSYTEQQRLEDITECSRAARRYAKHLEEGMSEEHARGMLPFDYRQHFVVTFNLRSLMHFLDLRAKKDAQLEIQQLCELMMPHFLKWSPEIAGWYQETRLGKGRLAP